MADSDLSESIKKESNWNVDLEVGLFHSMRRYKPVGVNRHFQMVLIHDRLNNSISQKIPAKEIWQHLGQMYDLQALNESEIIPFPNKVVDFSLPEYDYLNYFRDDFPRTPEATIIPDDGSDTPKQTGGKTRSTKVVPNPAVSNVASTPTNEDSPKREQRKRTRGQVSSDSPATKETTPSSKRARRT